MKLDWESAEVVPVQIGNAVSLELRVELTTRPDRFWRTSFQAQVGEVRADSWSIDPPERDGRMLTVRGPLSRSNIDQVAAVLDELLERVAHQADQSRDDYRKRCEAKRQQRRQEAERKRLADDAKKQQEAERKRLAHELTEHVRSIGRQAPAHGQPQGSAAAPSKLPSTGVRSLPGPRTQHEPLSEESTRDEDARILAQFAHLFDGLPDLAVEMESPPIAQPLGIDEIWDLLDKKGRAAATERVRWE